MSAATQRKAHLGLVAEVQSVLPPTVRAQWWPIVHAPAGRELDALAFGPPRGKGAVDDRDAAWLLQLQRRRLELVGVDPVARKGRGIGDANRKWLQRRLDDLDPEWCRLRLEVAPGQTFAIGALVAGSATSISAAASWAAHAPAPGFPPLGRNAEERDGAIYVDASPHFTIALDRREIF